MNAVNIVAVFLLLAVTLVTAMIHNVGWWKHTVFYQIYPRSFMDSDNNGVGDLKGITSKLQHFKDSGVGAIWLSPINRSPMADFGYDISDFRDVDETFGNLEDLKDLLKTAKGLGLKVVLDLVPNHTSDQHYWFQMSVNRVGKYANYYMWHDGKKNAAGSPIPPNNWNSVFNGSGWTYHPTRKQFYYHQFLPQQPDLNYTNPDVQEEMKEIIRYWLDKGMDGFRIDAVPHLFENNITQDEPPSNTPGAKPLEHIFLDHTLTKDQPQTYELIKSWREFVDRYADQNNQDEKVLMTEAYTSWEKTLQYYKYGSDVPFNFKFITDANGNSNITVFKNIIDRWMQNVPKGSVANWVMGNHDRTRIATRYGVRADQMTMLAMMLPGVAVTYYGEEIGMEDYGTFITYDIRDGCRTPFQWDNSLNAGFSNASKTWLPVNPNYRELNLEKEKADAQSHYNLYKGLTSLRSSSNALKNGELSTAILKNDVLAVVRKASNDTVTLLINFSNDKNVTVDLSNFVGNSETKIKLSNVDSRLNSGTQVKTSSVVVPAKASMILVSSGTTLARFSVASLLLTAFIALFKS